MQCSRRTGRPETGEALNRPCAADRHARLSAGLETKVEREQREKRRGGGGVEAGRQQSDRVVDMVGGKLRLVERGDADEEEGQAEEDEGEREDLVARAIAQRGVEGERGEEKDAADWH